MIRSSLRTLTGAYPLLTILGCVTICASGLVSFDTSLGLVTGTRVLHPAAKTTKVKGPVRRMVNGHWITITTVAPRAVKASEKGTGFNMNITYEKARCGDKLVLLSETCDDGNATGGDGCSAACQVETGYSCNGSQPSICWAACGDGKIAAPKEDCDDANSSAQDGCSPYCHKEPGYSCTGTPSVCTLL